MYTLTESQAKEALELQPTYQSSFGFWSYILAPYYQARGGKALHFWIRETEFGESYSPHYISVCGRSSKHHELPTSDYYGLSNMPRCKRCTSALLALQKS